MKVKKQFEEIYALLSTNQDKKVKTMLPQLLELMGSKGGKGSAKTFKTNDKGEATHIFCYYHKKWEPLTECEYGVKKSSASGYNTMCKEGVNQWSKQQRAKKAKEAALLERISSGELKVEDLPGEQQEILDEANVIVPRKDEIGFDTLD